MTVERLDDTAENRAMVRKELQAIRQRLAEIAASLDAVDHDAARQLHIARDAIHDGWRILRQSPLTDRDRD